MQAAPALRRMARLLYALSLLLEDGILADGLARMESNTADSGSAGLPSAAPHHLALLLQAALQDMASGFVNHAAIPSGKVHAFLKVSMRLPAAFHASIVQCLRRMGSEYLLLFINNEGLFLGIDMGVQF